MELFGGVAEYTTEFLLHMTTQEHDTILLEHLRVTVKNVATTNGGGAKEPLTFDWFNELKSPDNKCCVFRDAGLCGPEAPCNIILYSLLKILRVNSPSLDVLRLVQCFRSQFDDDPGMD